MSKMVYVPSLGSKLSKAQAEIVGRELQDIEKTNGAIVPEAIVSRAAPLESAIHSFFEWDDSEAAIEHRLNQARELARSVSIIVIPDKKNVGPTRAFVSVASHSRERRFEGRAYVSSSRALGDREYLEQIKAAALAEVRAWRRRNSQHGDLFSDVFAAIDGIK